MKVDKASVFILFLSARIVSWSSWRVSLSFCLLSCRILMTVLRLCVSMFSRKGPFFNYSLSGMNILRFISPSLSIYCCIAIRFSIFLRSTSISKAEYSSLVTSSLDTLAGEASTAN